MRILELAHSAFALLGLGVSVLLLAEYGGAAHTALCGVGGGCDVVRHSGWASPFGIPLPALGIVFFTVLFGAGVEPALRRFRPVIAGGGAAAGLAFLAIQAFDLGAFCWLCVIVDVSAIACGPLAWLQRDEDPPALSAGRRAAHGALVATVVVGAFGLHSLSAPAEAPASVAAPAGIPTFVSDARQPGTVTIVEFLDFQCPACRAQHERFRTVLPDFGDRVRVVLKHMPLPQHAFAMPAARAHLCAVEQDPAAGKRMADALFAATRPNPGTLPQIAETLGLDLDRLEACAVADGTTERLRRDLLGAREAGVSALPTFWIGDERFEGVTDTETVRQAIQRALAGTAPRSDA